MCFCACTFLVVKVCLVFDCLYTDENDVCACVICFNKMVYKCGFRAFMCSLYGTDRTDSTPNGHL